MNCITRPIRGHHCPVIGYPDDNRRGDSIKDPRPRPYSCCTIVPSNYWHNY